MEVKINKDINAIGNSIDEIASEEKDVSSFSLQQISIAVGTLIAVTLFMTLVVRRRRGRPSVEISKDDVDELDFDALLKKIRIDNLNKDIAKTTPAIKKAAPRKSPAKRNAAKKATPARKKAVAVKKSSSKKKNTTLKKSAAPKKIS